MKLFDSKVWYASRMGRLILAMTRRPILVW